MSQYRLSIVNGVVVRQKRALLRWWAWQFNRSEEDRLNTMKNNLVKARQAVSNLSGQIKKETERIKSLKDKINAWQGAATPSWRDRWSRRKEPVVLQEDIQLARKKKEREKQPQPAEIARLVLPQRR